MVNKKVSVGKFEINFTNRVLYTLITLVVITIFGTGVYAFGTIPNPGHAVSQIQTCDSAGQILKMSGGAWTCAADEVGVGGGVSKIIAGTGISISPTGGTGDVTITSAGGGTSVWSLSGSDTYYTAGKVGIGAVNPGNSKLYVYQENGADGTIAVDSDGFWPSGLVLKRGIQTEWGLYNAGDFYIVGGTSGTEPFRITPEGNVGIGITTPDINAKLDVSAGNDYEVALRLRMVANQNLFVWSGIGNQIGIIALSDANVPNSLAIAADNLNFYTSTATNTMVNRMMINSAGDVGIGTTSPTADLHVVGLGWFSGNLGTGGRLLVDGTGNSYFTGNVGIGTTGPTTKLQVAGTIYSTTGGFKFPDGTTQTTAATGGGGTSLWTLSGTSVYYNGGPVGIGTTAPSSLLDLDVGGLGWFSGNLGTGGNLVVTKNMSIDTNTLFVDSTNNRVGIGTTGPTQKLQVTGTIYSSSGGFKFPDGTTQTTASVGGGGGILGSGTTNYLSKWTAGTTLGNSVLYEKVGDIGIGTTDPIADLNVVGLGWFSGNLGTGGTLVVTGTGNSYLMGKVGIGTTSPGSILQVGGNSDGDAIGVIELGNSVTSKTENSIISATGTGGLKLKQGGIGGYISFEVGGAGEVMRVNDQGKVGIGTTNPIYPLDISEGMLRVWSGWGDGEFPDGVILDSDIGYGDSAIIGSAPEWGSLLSHDETYFHIISEEGLSFDVDADPIRRVAMTIDNTGTVKIPDLAGTGNAYVCVDAAGNLYRSSVKCL